MCTSCKNSIAKASSSKTCGGNIRRLNDARNKLATLQNYISDLELKDKYKRDKEEVDEILRQHAITLICPEHSLVITIENEVNNEYAKYY